MSSVDFSCSLVAIWTDLWSQPQCKLLAMAGAVIHTVIWDCYCFVSNASRFSAIIINVEKMQYVCMLSLDNYLWIRTWCQMTASFENKKQYKDSIWWNMLTYCTLLWNDTFNRMILNNKVNTEAPWTLYKPMYLIISSTVNCSRKYFLYNMLHRTNVYLKQSSTNVNQKQMHKETGTRGKK